MLKIKIMHFAQSYLQNGETKLTRIDNMLYDELMDLFACVDVVAIWKIKNLICLVS